MDDLDFEETEEDNEEENEETVAPPLAEFDEYNPFLDELQGIEL